MYYIDPSMLGGISLYDSLSFKLYFDIYCGDNYNYSGSQTFDLIVISTLKVELIDSKLFIGTPYPLLIVQFSWTDSNYGIVDSLYGKNLDVISGVDIYKYVLFGPTELISE